MGYMGLTRILVEESAGTRVDRMKKMLMRRWSSPQSLTKMAERLSGRSTGEKWPLVRNG
jgi:hypothetical protein